MKFPISHPTVAIIVGSFACLFNIVAAICFVYPLLEEKYGEFDTGSESKLGMPLYVGMFSCILGAFLSILMVTGVCLNRYKLIAPYVYFGLFGLVSSGGLWMVSIGGHIFNLVPFESLWELITRCILTEGLQIFVWLPIFALYKEWKATANGTQTPHQMDDRMLNVTHQRVIDVEKIPAITAAKVV